jgi:hypothetical protein
MWDAPGTHERTLMRKRCGKKCFLGPNTSYPVCARHTCKITPEGALAAYIRARQWKHPTIAARARRLIKSASTRRASRS